MTQYLINPIPNLTNYKNIQDASREELVVKSPQLNYILVFNPLLVSDDDESNSEALKQIISINIGEYGGNNKLDNTELIRIIGVIRGLQSFAKNFNNDENSKLMTIRTNNSSIIIQKLEESYYLVCSISLDQNECKCETLNKQISELIIHAYRIFVLFNTSFSDIREKYDIKVLKRLSEDYWGAFLRRYNTNEITSLPKISWPNGLNHKGFLGLLTKGSERTYKKSSINYHDLSSIIDHDMVDHTLLPCGMVIACFDKNSPKKYGLIHMETLSSSSPPNVQKQSLIDIYNWLEFFDCHNILKEEFINSTDGMFSIIEQNPEIVPETVDDSDIRSIRSTAVNALEMINPITLTNNLVISPFNYTMNSVMSYGNSSEQSTENTEGNNWLKIPSVFQNIYSREEYQNKSTNSSVTHIDTEGDGSPDLGEFLIGAVADKISNEITISRKLVYLKVLHKDSNGEEKEVKREHLLVVYLKGDICVGCIYDSSNTELDNIRFYEKLSEDIIQPLVDDVNSHGLNGSYMSNTIDSLKSLNGSITHNSTINGEGELDHDFFYLAYDLKEKYFKTSLPYLPITNDKRSSLASGMNNAMFYLHDQLIDLFVIQQKGDFFQDTCSINEYFHKFNNTRTSDWMFYYIKHHGKVIIIIKNRSNTASNSAKRKSGSSRNSSLILKQSALTEGAAPGFLHQISDGVYEYAHLGFLDNLGDDIKTWLENFSFSGES